MTKKVALIGWFGHGAFADDLIGVATRNELKKLGYVTYTDSYPQVDRLPDFMRQFSHIVFGGGSLLCPTNIYPMSAFPQWYPKVSKVPFHILGTGFRKEAEHLSTEQITLNKAIIRIAKSVWLRGNKTVSELNKSGILANIDGIGDPGILFQRTKKIDLPGPEPHLGIVSRNIPDIEVKFVHNKFVHSYFIDFLRIWLANFGGSVHFVSFRHIKPVYDNDMHAMRYIGSNIFTKHKYFHTPKNGEEAGNFISSMTHVLSQRLHPTIVALANRIPAVGMDYQFGKMEDFASAVGFSKWFSTQDLPKGFKSAEHVDWLAKFDYSSIFSNIEKKRNDLILHMKRTF